MKSLRSTRSFVVVASLCIAPALAAPGPQLSQTRVREFASAATDPVGYSTSDDGALWARGGDYKASFDAAGATYYPRFSPRQPKNYAHALSPASATVGGAELAFDRGAQAVRDGDHVAIDRGAFVEQYELAPNAIEQRFVFATLPARGEIALRIETGSELDRAECERGLEFRHELGRMNYGRATAIDALGRQVAAQTRLVGGAIEIRVPPEFVARATLPLVIDPVVQTLPIDTTTTRDDAFADCAYDAFHQRWLVVYFEQFSATDGDVKCRLFDNAGTEVGFVFLDASGTNWSDPRCADMSGWHNFLLVAGVGPTGAQVIRGAALTPNPFNLTASALVSGAEVGDKRHPDVGGDTHGPPSFGCVAYEHVISASQSELIVRYLNGDGSASGAGSLTVPSLSNNHVAWPAVSSSSGGFEWLVAWSYEWSASFAEILGVRVALNGTLLQGPFPMSIASTTFDRAPSVSSPMQGSSGRRHAVSFERSASFNGQADIVVVAMDGGTRLAEEDLHDLEGASTSIHRTGSSIECDGRHFLCAYAEATTPSNYDVLATELYLADTAFGVAENRTHVASTADNEFRPEVASMGSSGGPTESWMLVWDSGQFNGSGQRDIRGALYDGGAGGEIITFCTGSAAACPCGNGGALNSGCANSANAGGGSLIATGSPSSVDDQITLHVSGVPAHVTCLIFESAYAFAPVTFGDGLRCVTAPVTRVTLRSASGGGNLTYPALGDPKLSVVGSVPLEGGTRVYQTWYRDPASFCTNKTSNLTNGVAIVWAP